MPRFEELAAHPSSRHQSPSTSASPDLGNLVAKRYSVLQILGRGSFGTVYVVHDIRSGDKDNLWQHWTVCNQIASSQHLTSLCSLLPHVSCTGECVFAL
ncbi:hypothetical protein DPEC_G00140850 [Dallia pectoralis]|uniref:Uncharacterized protein n=1 Tax=Dallia pectoralis TaxID=75939 RepID=A0ACC2GMK2_DALPE|nr:hypothetical protein DPEC_G00140850 [Dallia pectoralis]